MVNTAVKTTTLGTLPELGLTSGQSEQLQDSLRQNVRIDLVVVAVGDDLGNHRWW